MYPILIGPFPWAGETDGFKMTRPTAATINRILNNVFFMFPNLLP
jgi:hypothetical protein